MVRDQVGSALEGAWGGTLGRVVALWGGLGNGLGARGLASGQKRPAQGWVRSRGSWGGTARGGHLLPSGPRWGPQLGVSWAGSRSGKGLGPQLAFTQSLEGSRHALPGSLGSGGLGGH